MSMALQKCHVFSPCPDDTREWHPHNSSFTPLFPFAIKSREEGGAGFWKANSQSRGILGMNWKPRARLTTRVPCEVEGEAPGWLYSCHAHTLFSYDSIHSDRGEKQSLVFFSQQEGLVCADKREGLPSLVPKPRW